MVNVKQPFNIDIGAKVPALAAVSKDIRTKLGGVFNRVGQTLGLVNHKVQAFNGSLVESSAISEKTAQNISKQFKKTSKRVQETSKDIDSQRKSFPAWALSLMFAGHMIQRMYQQIARTGTQTFNTIMRSQDYTRSNFEHFQNTVTKAWFYVGQALEPIWAYLTKIVDKVAEWIKENPKIVQQKTEILGVLGTIFTVIGSIVLLVAALTKMFSAIAGWKIWGLLAQLGVWIWGIIKVIAAAVGIAAGWVAAIVAAVIAAIVLLIVYWDEVWAFLKKLWGWIKQAFMWLVNGIVWVAKKIWGALKWAFNAVWSGLKWLWNKFLDIGAWILNLFISIGEGIYNGLISGIEGAINGAIRLINKFIRGVNKRLGGWGVSIGEVPEVNFGRADFGRIERASPEELSGEARGQSSTETYNDNRTIEVNVEVDDSEGLDEILSEYIALR